MKAQFTKRENYDLNILPFSFKLTVSWWYTDRPAMEEEKPEKEWGALTTCLWPNLCSKMNVDKDPLPSHDMMSVTCSKGQLCSVVED